jgi:D-arabinose 1-dehydrogenase-like Zn-dependent alcohol dehydrogenase
MPKMRAAQVAVAKRPFEVVERAIPEPGRGLVRVKVQASGICHSDSLTKEGLWPAIASVSAGTAVTAGSAPRVGAATT